jgi:uncharacterized RDD family membrane protein YckC
LKLPGIEDVKHELAEIYDSPAFGIYCIGGSVILVGLTNDVLWLLIGLGGFLYKLFKG